MDKTALFWLLNLNNFDEHPVWLRSNQFSADCHYWQCHSVKSQKVGIIYYDFPSVHARSRWTESRTLIGWSRGPDIFSGQLAFSSGPLEWWPFDYFDKWSSNYSQSTWPKPTTATTTEIGQYYIISSLHIRLWSLQFLCSTLIFCWFLDQYSHICLPHAGLVTTVDAKLEARGTPSKFL